MYDELYIYAYCSVVHAADGEWLFTLLWYNKKLKCCFFIDIVYTLYAYELDVNMREKYNLIRSKIRITAAVGIVTQVFFYKYTMLILMTYILSLSFS